MLKTNIGNREYKTFLYNASGVNRITKEKAMSIKIV